MGGFGRGQLAKVCRLSSKFSKQLLPSDAWWIIMQKIKLWSCQSQKQSDRDSDSSLFLKTSVSQENSCPKCLSQVCNASSCNSIRWKGSIGKPMATSPHRWENKRWETEKKKHCFTERKWHNIWILYKTHLLSNHLVVGRESWHSVRVGPPNSLLHNGCWLAVFSAAQGWIRAIRNVVEACTCKLI